MSRIDDLIAEHCPDGVEFRALGELGSLYGGLTGKTKADFGSGHARYMSYVNVFGNPATDLLRDDLVAVSDGERQKQIALGDVLFTASSENAEEVGMSSTVVSDPQGPIYLNSFCFGFRPADGTLLVPDFSKHLFRSPDVRRQIVRTASGVTRFNISKARFAGVRVPLPPVPVQRAIVDVLDRFTELETELEAELEAEREARRRQYEHHRDALLSFRVQGEVRWVPMGEIGEFIRGRRFTKEDMAPTGLASIHYGEIYTKYGTATTTTVSHVKPELAPRLRFARPRDVVVAAVGETVEDVGKAVAWLGETDVAVHDDCFIFRQPLDPKFVAYYFQTKAFHAEKAKHVARAKVKRLSGESLSRLTMPVPPLADQERVVSILDSFDTLVTGLSAGLPAELKARQRQYEYYRDKLLTFDQAPA